MLQGRPLVHQLVARAFVLGLDPSLTTAAQAVRLARLAAGDRAQLERAVRIIESHPNHRSPLAVQAVEALQVAATIVRDSSRRMPGESPGNGHAPESVTAFIVAPDTNGHTVDDRVGALEQILQEAIAVTAQLWRDE